jgi:ATP-binding cassette subfamily C (CFTR/MRP) protein 4
MMRAGMQMRVGFIALVYKKLLQLSIAHTASGGVIVNMVSNDVQRFEDLAPFLSFIVVGPAQVVLSTIFMYLQIGPASFGSVVALLLLIPLQGFFAKQFGGLRKKTVMFTDERIRSLSDMFIGMMVVKLNAWEKPFCEKIGLVRDQELKYIQKGAVIRAFNEAFSFASTGNLI